MSIVDGQRVRALESNAAWASKSADNTLVGKQTLSRPGSGASIPDLQQKVNDHDSSIATQTGQIATIQSDIADLQALPDLVYIGAWDASTNSPTLADGDGGGGYGPGAIYRVSVAGTQNLGSGSFDYVVGDKVVYRFDGIWEKWDVQDDEPLALLNDVYFTGRNFANSGDVNLLKVNTSDEIQLGDGLSEIRISSDVVGDVNFSNSLLIGDNSSLYWGSSGRGLWVSQGSGTNFFAFQTKDHANNSVDTPTNISVLTGSKPGASSTGATGNLYLHTGYNDGSGNSGGSFLFTGDNNGSGNSGVVQITSGTCSGASAVSGDVNIFTGDTGATGTTGSITLWPGFTSGGTVGKIKLRPTSAATTAGHVWTCTGTAGEGTWQAPGASGANDTLSNLASPTSVNQDLIMQATKSVVLKNDVYYKARNVGDSADVNLIKFGSDDTIQLGDGTKNFRVNGNFVAFSDNTNDLGSPFYYWRRTYSYIVSGSGWSLENSTGPSATVSGIHSNYFNNLGLYTENRDTADSGASSALFLDTGNVINAASTGVSGNMQLKTGNTLGVTGATGNISILTGNSSGSASGNITLQTGTGGTVRGDVFLNSRILWVQASSGVNCAGSIVPNLTTTYNLGSPTQVWNITYSKFVLGFGADFVAGTVADSTFKATFKTGDSSVGNSAQVELKSGNAISTNNSGAVLIASGTVVSGSRGAINIQGNRVDASASVGPLRLPNLSADPGSPANGDMWYNTTSNQLKAYVNGSVTVIA